MWHKKVILKKCQFSWGRVYVLIKDRNAKPWFTWLYFQFEIQGYPKKTATFKIIIIPIWVNFVKIIDKFWSVKSYIFQNFKIPYDSDFHEFRQKLQSFIALHFILFLHHPLSKKFPQIDVILNLKVTVCSDWPCTLSFRTNESGE